MGDVPMADAPRFAPTEKYCMIMKTNIIIGLKMGASLTTSNSNLEGGPVTEGSSLLAQTQTNRS